MKQIILPILLTVLPNVSFGSDAGSVVKAHYAKSQTLAGTEQIVYFSLDINKDGKPDFFVSHEGATNGKLGNIWQVYLSQGTNFVAGESLVCFNFDSIIIPDSSLPNESCILVASYPIMIDGSKGLRFSGFFWEDGLRLKERSIAHLTVEDEVGMDILRGIWDGNSRPKPALKILANGE